MMTKLELNDKLARLYGEDSGYEIVNENKYSDSITTLLIDDWNGLMPLALKQQLHIEIYNWFVSVCHVRDDKPSFNFDAEFKDHESPEDAVRYAIAMTLVKFAESK